MPMTGGNEVGSAGKANSYITFKTVNQYCALGKQSGNTLLNLKYAHP